MKKALKLNKAILIIFHQPLYNQMKGDHMDQFR